MKITTKFMFALALFGSLAFTSCKDYEEDSNINSTVANQATQDELTSLINAAKTEIADLQTTKEVLQQAMCKCELKTADDIDKYFNLKSTIESLENRQTELKELINGTGGSEGATSIQTQILQLDSIINGTEDTPGSTSAKGLKQQIEDLKEAIYGTETEEGDTTGFQKRIVNLETKIQDCAQKGDVATKIALQDSVVKLREALQGYTTTTEMTNAITNATKNLKDSTWITTSITKALAGNANQEWVNEQLKTYVTNSQLNDSLAAVKQFAQTALTTEVTKLNTAIGNAQTDATNALNTISDIQKTMADTSYVKRKLEEAKTNLQGQINTLKDVTIPGLETKISKVNDRCTLLHDSIANNITAINDVKTKLESMYTNDQIDELLGKKVSEETLENYAKLSVLSDSCTKLRTSISAINTAQLNLAGLVNTNTGDIASLKSSLETANGNITSVTNRVSTLETTANNLASRISQVSDSLKALYGAVDSLKDARKKQVTGIIIQQVWNPAFGAYSGVVTDIKSDMLIAYYGEFSSKINYFPAFSVNDTKNNRIKGLSGTLISGTGNAGKLYLTLNPNTLDFQGLSGLQLVNSQETESAMKIGDLQPSSSLLTLGWTRADNKNGFYEADVTLDQSEIGKTGSLTVDKTGLKNAIKTIMNGSKKQGIKDMAVSIANSLRSANQLQANAVKCGWTDAYGEHAVYSNYGIATIAAKPLGFNAVNDVDIFNKETGDYWKGVDKVKQLIKNASARAGKSISEFLNKELNLKTLKADIGAIDVRFIDSVKLSDAQKESLKMTLTFDSTFYIGVKVDASVGNVPIDGKIDWNGALEEMEVPTEFSYDKDGDSIIVTKKEKIKYLADENKITIKATADVKPEISTDFKTSDKTIPGYQCLEIHFHKDFTVDMTDKIESIITGINHSLMEENTTLRTLKQLMDDTKLIMGTLDSLEDKLNDGTYLSEKILTYVDNVATKIANYGQTYLPRLFKPTLLINSDNGFGICKTEGQRSYVKGDVYIYPTTYSMELLTPIYKRYVRIREVKYENGGYVTVSTPFEKLYDGCDKAGKSINITPYIHSGKTYAIDYDALDYTGQTEHMDQPTEIIPYIITVK